MFWLVSFARNDALLRMTTRRNVMEQRPTLFSYELSLPFHADYLPQSVHDFHQIRLCRHYRID